MIALGMPIGGALFAIYTYVQIGRSGTAYKSADHALLFVFGMIVALAGLATAVLT